MIALLKLFHSRLKKQHTALQRFQQCSGFVLMGDGNHKVLGAIVVTDAINVMNNLASPKRAPKHPLHNGAMFKSVAARVGCSHHDVPSPCDESATAPVTVSFAGSAGVVTPRSERETGSDQPVLNSASRAIQAHRDLSATRAGLIQSDHLVEREVSLVGRHTAGDPLRPARYACALQSVSDRARCQAKQSRDLIKALAGLVKLDHLLCGHVWAEPIRITHRHIIAL